MFAWVELLPREISPPEDDGEVGRRLQKSHLYVRHVVTTADRARRWYRDCARGVVVLPTSEGVLPEPGPEVIALQMSSIDDEPRWPNLVCTRSEILPFLANWYECPRVHHLLQRGFSLGALWNDTQQATARKWLVEQLHFDIGEHHALWGSVHLVAPNFKLVGGRPRSGQNPDTFKPVGGNSRSLLPVPHPSSGPLAPGSTSQDRASAWPGWDSIAPQRSQPAQWCLSHVAADSAGDAKWLHWGTSAPVRIRHDHNTCDRAPEICKDDWLARQYDYVISRGRSSTFPGPGQ